MNEIAPLLAGLDIHNVYESPRGYFDTFPERVLDIVREHEIGLPTQKAMADYELPENYFEHLAERILIKAKAITEEEDIALHIKEELRLIAPTLAAMEKKDVFSVPAGYFDNSLVAVPVPEFQKNEETKVVRLYSKSKKWFSYVAAACMLTVISSSAYIYVNHHMKTVDNSLTIEQRLATVNDSEIMNYLESTDTDDFQPASYDKNNQDATINNLLLNTSDEEIEDYVN